MAGKPSDGPVEAFRQVTGAAMRAIARDPELQVAFAPEPAALRGKEARLPAPSREVAREEMAAVAALRDAGRIGAVHLSLPRGTVFIETFATDEDDARSVIGSLPMARWWRLDPYPCAAPPVGPG